MAKVTRNLHQNLHSNKNRTNSSGLWLSRSINDPYVLKARKDGYRSRAAYKLVEIDDKMHLIGKSHSILDLGAAPGSWSQVLRTRAPKLARIVALDILEMECIEGVEFISIDITLGSGLLMQAVRSADLIVSDIAPNFCGIPEADHLQSIELCEEVLGLLPGLMQRGGAFIMKTFQGAEEPDLFRRTKAMFSAIKRIKPSSSRKESGELYYCATGFLGQRHKAT